MYRVPRSELHVHPTYQPLFRARALAPESLFTHPDIKVWRSLPDRENCTLDTTLDDKEIRLHIKRYPPTNPTAAPAEVTGHTLLTTAQIPTATLVAHGRTLDNRTFTVFADLAPHAPADKLLSTNAITFDKLLHPTAQLAAQLHNANLHHRDLYLCHFFADPSTVPTDLKLIDVARVAQLRNPLTRRRWIIKDLAQFWYSTLAHPQITDAHRQAWLAHYAHERKLNPQSLLPAIQRKSNAIARHDANLKRSQPNRNISIPTERLPCPPTQGL